MNAIWEGTILFGLVHIPVKLYPLTRGRRIDFEYLRKNDLCKIKNVRICEETGEEVPYQDIVRGFKQKGGKYIIVTGEDFKQAAEYRINAIEIIHFTYETEIPSKYYEKPFLLESALKVSRSYVLLRDTLKRSKKIAIVKFILKAQENIGILKPEEEHLTIYQIRYPHQIRKDVRPQIPEHIPISENEFDMATKLVDEMTEHFDPDKYRDTYTEELKQIITAKSKGEEYPRTRKTTKPKPTSDKELDKKLKESIAYIDRTYSPSS